MLATSAMSEVQTQAMPSMTLPATVLDGSVPVTRTRMAQIHAMAAVQQTMAISSADVPLEKPRVLTVNDESAELPGMSENLVEAVAAVATQVVMSPSPQTTCPVT